MKVALVLLALVACSFAAMTEQQYQDAFTSWMQTYQKVYAFDEFSNRYVVFKSNLDFVNQHNGNPENTFEVGLNAFADLTNAEFNRLYKGFVLVRSQVNPEPEVLNKVRQQPASFDWRTKGAVTGVKNQGQCGSCWSFSATGSMEGACEIAGRGLVGLSEQNLMDCSTAQGNQACNGGEMDAAFRYVIQNQGIDTEASYPYTARDGTCHFSKTGESNCHIATYHDVASGSETALLDAVAKQPVSVAIDASHSSFQMYKSGVYYEPACSTRQLDHGVLAIGWGTDGGSAYWLVKNSWGADWGMAGFIYMSRNRANNCGIATAASYPSV